MFILFLLGFILFFEIYFYQGVRTIISDFSNKRQRQIKTLYWSYTLFVTIFMLLGLVMPLKELPGFVRVYLMSFIIIITVSKIFSTLVLLIDDVLRVLRWIGKKLLMFKENPGISAITTGNKISRYKFLSQVSIIVAMLPFVHMIYGLFIGAHKYTIHRNRLKIPGLPSKFNGLKIVQISDIHCGSFLKTKPLEEAIKLINDQKPDMVFFTGDLVNDHADETDRFVGILNKIKAPLGVFSCFGNHDYGDYYKWKSPEEKIKNRHKLINRQRVDFGWDLLLNENRVIEKGGEKIAIIGVENIGRTERFPKYGDLEKSLKGVEDIEFKLLLSHDPYHFTSEVSEKYPEINFTFSGHTHGMQFGVELPGIKWSPVQYVYKHWAGLLKQKNQYLYVNRGLGYIGYAGRAGIWPEITVHELYSTSR